MQRWIAADSLPRRQQPEDYALIVVIVLASWLIPLSTRVIPVHELEQRGDPYDRQFRDG